VLNEKVLSAILEFAVDLEQLPRLFEILAGGFRQEIECVFSRGSGHQGGPGRRLSHQAVHRCQAGIWVAPNGKTNVGLGKPQVRGEIGHDPYLAPHAGTTWNLLGQDYRDPVHAQQGYQPRGFCGPKLLPFFRDSARNNGAIKIGDCRKGNEYHQGGVEAGAWPMWRTGR
jgi:hypothetical protein